MIVNRRSLMIAAAAAGVNCLGVPRKDLGVTPDAEGPTLDALAKNVLG